ncbi:putative adenylyltransferase/sulfurtransferase MoeZ [Acidipropionibacterium virtanenii]|uniref:Putative adenylyltransferase/sulfurtransferase MoeZ n=1 Tax=Acidipropionibacterium virtanenii TaxID=2057246 RepID=A0A344UPY6_9ACTN|nr:putative adenylyltransferase/sulfurtransferase MoeZ [Acidipropionibacterium virtanenii]
MNPLVNPGPALSGAEAVRYSRHLSLPGFGDDGQRRLRAARVLVVGAGGLGAPVLQYLVAAGVGRITVIDDDVVEASNLQRQVLHREADLGRPKAESACDAALRLDSASRVTAIVGRLDADNALDLFASHDLVVDGSDNFATRYLSNDAAEITGTPLVWGTIFRFEGQVSVFWPGQGPMLRDLFPDIPDADSVPNCAEGGVLGVLCGTIGSAMATEAVKVLCGIGEPMVGRLMIYDALAAGYTFLTLAEDPDREKVTALASDYAFSCAVETPVTEVSAEELAAERTGSQRPAPLVLDVREDWERGIVSIPDDHWVPLGRIRQDGWDAVAGVLADSSGNPPAEVVVYCKAGVRSAEAVRLLTAGAPAGTRLRSLAGGVLAVPGAPRY